jgi:hypothetical protein
MSIVWILSLALFMCVVAIIGLVVDRRILTKKMAASGGVGGAVESVVQEVEHFFSPDELTVPALQAALAELQAKIAQAQKANAAEFAGIHAQAVASQEEAAQLGQLKATIGATAVAPAPAPEAPQQPASP